MKKTIALIILAVAVFAAAIYAYNNLSESFSPSASDLLNGGNTPSGDTVDVEGVTSEDTSEDPSADTDPETDAPDVLPAPDFTVYDGDGNPVKLSDFFGKPIIVNFWATWCPPCKSELPHFEKKFAEYGDEIEFLMVNLTDGGRDTVEVVKEFVAEGGYTFPVYYDTEYSAAMTYGTSSIPVTVFIDADGDLLGGITGAMDIDTLQQCIDITLGKDVTE